MTPLSPTDAKYLNAYDIFETLKNKYSLMILPSGGRRRNSLIRVGHMGHLTIEDNKLLVESMKGALAFLRGEEVKAIIMAAGKGTWIIDIFSISRNAQ